MSTTEPTTPSGEALKALASDPDTHVNPARLLELAAAIEADREAALSQLATVVEALREYVKETREQWDEQGVWSGVEPRGSDLLADSDLSTAAVRNHSKTVTRRLGWWNLKPGTILQAVEKAQGLKKGEHVKPICLIRVVSVARERLHEIVMHDGDCAREGFPELSPTGFIDMFQRGNHMDPNPEFYGQWWVNRIEFEYE